MIETLADQMRLNARTLLPRLISQISEAGWCAGWLNDIEHTLWEAIGHYRADRFLEDGKMELGMSHVEPRTFEALQTLSRAADGWFVYDPEEGETFVVMTDWLRLHTAWLDARDQARAARQLAEDACVREGGHHWQGTSVPWFNHCRICTAIRDAGSL